MSGTEAPRWKDKGLDCILKHAPEPCLFFCCCRNTHALHGFRGSGHSSAESEELWTRPTWRYRAPETQQARRHKPWNSVSGESKSNTWFCMNNLQAIFFDGNNPPTHLPRHDHVSTVISTVQSLSWKSHSETQAHKSMKGATAGGI